MTTFSYLDLELKILFTKLFEDFVFHTKYRLESSAKLQKVY